MNRYRRPATIRMPKSSVGASLPDFRKPQLSQERLDLARLENRRLCHGLRHFDGLSPDELTLQPWSAFLEEHLDDFLKVRP